LTYNNKYTTILGRTIRNYEEVYHLKLLSFAILEQNPPEPNFEPVDWDRIFSEAVAHEVNTQLSKKRGVP
jgi:hypothetical protein